MWTDLYRPTSLDEMALTPDIRDEAAAYLARGEAPHLFLVGPQGCGKTTLAMIIQRALDYGFRPEVNGSDRNARRSWATGRKHLPVQDVMAVGGWTDPSCLTTIYQQPDVDTMLRVATEAAEVREVQHG
jgi:energy-coupling factor transporter ATP-binding protein EcfA2